VLIEEKTIMITQENDFLINDTELFELVQHIQPEKSRLAILPGQQPAVPTGVLQDYEKLTEEKHDSLEAIVRGLAAPVRLMRLHYTIADETISRQVIAWPGASDNVITLAGNGTNWRASTNSEFGVRTLIKEVLAAGSDLRRDPICLALSSFSLLVFLGILEQLRYARLYSNLVNQAPVTLFAASHLLERMHQSIVEDFRWPLAMFEKVLPVKMMENVKLEDVNEGLKELVKLELVEVCDDKGLVFELSEAGNLIADGVLHEVSKAALCVSQYRSDGVLGHDAILLVRSFFYLFLFEMAGPTGVLATLDDEGADLFLAKTMEIPDDETVNAAKPMAGVPIEQPVDFIRKPDVQPQETLATAKPGKFCRKCGKPIQADALFCPNCGEVVSGKKPSVKAQVPGSADVCPQCGKPIRPGAKFCRNCGKAL
jgi:predicted nucleic acid-binding Zn ribbon protein